MRACSLGEVGRGKGGASLKQPLARLRWHHAHRPPIIYGHISGGKGGPPGPQPRVLLVGGGQRKEEDFWRRWEG